MAANTGGMPNQNVGMDDFLGPIILIAVFFVVLWATWAMNQTVIVAALFKMVRWISTVGQYVPWLYPDEMTQNFENWSRTLHLVDPRNYGSEAAVIMVGVVCHTLALIVFPWLFWRVITLQKEYVVNRFVRRLDLDALSERNANYYAAIASIQGEDLINQPVHQGPWAINRSPMDFCLERQLIHVLVRKHKAYSKLVALMNGMGGSETDQEVKRRKIKGWSEKKMDWSLENKRSSLPPASQMRLDRDACDKVMIRQLGPLWTNHNDLNDFEKCVLAIFFVAIGKSLKSARELALEKAKSFKRRDSKGRHNPTIDMSGVDKILNKYCDHPLVKRCASRHAFKTTFFCSLLEEIWRKGVFTTSEILWLKPVDRTLFFTLNQMGGDRPFTEAAGPWAHFIVEKTARQPIQTPCIEAATDALAKMLYEEEWIGSEEGLFGEVEIKKAAATTSNNPEDYVKF